MIITYGQGLMLIGFSLIFGPFFEEPDVPLSQRAKSCIISIINIVPGLFLIIIGAITYIFEYMRFLLKF